jgi:hypothetical protein
MIGFTGWFHSFDINNWHSSLKKIKNCNKGKNGKEISWIIVRQKRVCIFSAKDVVKNVRERSNGGNEKQKGLNAKINANNLCQRKLF